jgi:hypothetical protein
MLCGVTKRGMQNEHTKQHLIHPSSNLSSPEPELQRKLIKASMPISVNKSFGFQSRQKAKQIAMIDTADFFFFLFFFSSIQKLSYFQVLGFNK